MFCNAALLLALLNTACFPLFVHKVMAFSHYWMLKPFMKIFSVGRVTANQDLLALPFARLL
jgi:hypothetical protein